MTLLALTTLLAAPPAMADGATSYATFCVICHGATGKGDGAAAAALDPKPADFSKAAFWTGKSDADLKKVIKEGGTAVGKSPLMPPWGGSLTDAQINEIVVYLKTLKKG